MIPVLLLSLAMGFTGAIVPGSLFAYTVNQSLLVGWTAGLWLTLGHLLAELVLLLGLRAGLGGILTRKAVTHAIGIVGGLVLLYFAWDMAQVALHGFARSTAGSGTGLSAAALFGAGVLLTVTQPYWYLWWATAGVGLIGTQVERHGPRAWGAFFIGHGLADLIWYLAVSTLFAYSGSFLGARVHQGLILICALGVAVLAVLFFVRPLREIARARRSAPAVE